MVQSKMQEFLTPADKPCPPPFHYPGRIIAPDKSRNEVNSRCVRVENYLMEMPSDDQFKMTLLAGSFSSTISFQMPLADAQQVQIAVDRYMKKESPTLEELTIVLVKWVTAMRARNTLMKTSDPSSSKYAKDGRSALYLHEAAKKSPATTDRKIGRPPQDAAKLKIDMRLGSNIAELIHSGFRRFQEIRSK